MFLALAMNITYGIVHTVIIIITRIIMDNTPIDLTAITVET